MSAPHSPQIGSVSHLKGRGAQANPPNRFERISIDDDFEHLDPEDADAPLPTLRTEYFDDDSRSIVSENDSPDIPFRYSVNPYRGCAHGCSYCYARPTHEYLGLGAGIDFESRILVKRRAPELLRQWLARDKWQCEPIMLSGVTDCYQPAERHFRLTRGCLEVALAARQPVCIVTKNALVTRDLDLLSEMARLNIVHVNLSVTSLDAPLARVMEPRTSSPAVRLRAIRELSAAGIPTGVLVAPVIPGLNDVEIPAILSEVSAAGARWAGYVLLRLPLAVRPVFQDWLARAVPSKQRRIESMIRSTRGGKLNSAKFGDRMKGSGFAADQIRATFKLFARRNHLDGKHPPLDTSLFRSRLDAAQLRLF